MYDVYLDPVLIVLYVVTLVLVIDYAMELFGIKGLSLVNKKDFDFEFYATDDNMQKILSIFSILENRNNVFVRTNKLGKERVVTLKDITDILKRNNVNSVRIYNIGEKRIKILFTCDIQTITYICKCSEDVVKTFLKARYGE